ENAAVWTYVLGLSTRSVILHTMGEIPDALADAQTAVEIIAEERWSGRTRRCGRMCSVFPPVP
ncbi:hypothetical protein AB4Z54_69935, partial [Streptomyces sp. MCAF7]